MELFPHESRFLLIPKGSGRLGTVTLDTRSQHDLGRELLVSSICTLDKPHSCDAAPAQHELCVQTQALGFVLGVGTVDWSGNCGAVTE